MKSRNTIGSNRVYPIMALSMIFVLLCSLAFAQALLEGRSHPKFQNTLPKPARIDKTKGGNMTIGMYQKVQYLGLVDASGTPLPTTVWAYGTSDRTATYPGPTIIAMENKRLYVRWENHLPGHFLPVDPTLHMAHPHGVDVATWYGQGNVPTVTHLHGGHTESASDGLPEAWFTQGFAETGNYFVKQTYRYDNDQEAGTLWYHDHALGITRLNVYAGLAGYYFLRDNHELSMTTDRRTSKMLPHPDYEYEFVIQDRMFKDNGELFYPSKSGDPWFGDCWKYAGYPCPDPEPLDVGAQDPSAVAEFFGDFILVNGVPWPKLEVEPRKYRFRMLNGSDSRFYVLQLSNGDPLLQIGSDVAFLNQALNMQKLVFAPGERADIIIDFSGYVNGTEIILQNVGPDSPFGGDEDNDLNRPTAVIAKFIVNQPLSRLPDAQVVAGSVLNTIAAVDPASAATTRQLVLFEGTDDKGRLQPLLGVYSTNAADNLGSLAWFEDITENPMLGDTEIWEVINATMDAHPIHLHLVAFQVLERGTWTGTTETKVQLQHDESEGVGGRLLTYSPTYVSGPEVNEQNAWKDTHIVYPDGYSKVIATFDRPGRYVWHCHILSHEDHEMMRPYYVGNMTNARIASNDITIEQNSPNPFSSSTQIRFELDRAETVQLNVFDLNGKNIYQYAEHFSAGKHALFWDGYDKEHKLLPNGIYIYKLTAESFEDTKRLMIER